MDIIADEGWDYIIFHDGKRYVLTFPSGGPGVYEISVELSQMDGDFLRKNPRMSREFAHNIMTNIEKYQEKRIFPPLYPSKKSV